MKYLYVCNTSSDSISKVDLDTFTEADKILLKNDFKRVGPHGICICNNCIFTANNYTNGISIVDINNKRNIENYTIGMHCNDVRIFKDTAYVICGNSNILAAFNLKEKKIETQIPCGSLPHSMHIDKIRNIMVIANMNDDSITMVDCKDNKVIKNIRVGAYPTKAIFSPNGDYIYVCESNLGLNSKGSIAIISLKNFQILNRVKVGNSPVDMFLDTKFCYVSNFGDGSVSIVDMANAKEIKVIRVGGMPRGIMRLKNYLYVGDNYNDLLMKINVASESKKVISIGGEPTGMTLI
ncbi:YncE family protein [Haloimpatiens lingqiaonensis]|uniref:YncE family protein n=1 Tax=Haloimpatiens lingqiaonensis TaxID=1380675 RepID=UPI0010FCE8F2|nr:YncE family protein [Haloimpatiens lingqiaonensis]